MLVGGQAPKAIANVDVLDFDAGSWVSGIYNCFVHLSKLYLCSENFSIAKKLFKLMVGNLWLFELYFSEKSFPTTL